MTRFLVQASSVSWSGAPDLCMNPVDGRPAVHWTVKKIFDQFSNARVTIVAPEFDRGGKMEELRTQFSSRDLDILYAHDESPLRRMIRATAELSPAELFVRVDGLHLWFDVPSVEKMLSAARQQALDCVKFPDDYPPQFASEVYRVSAVRRLLDLLGNLPEPEANRYHVHPKFLLMRLPEFKTRYLEDVPAYDPDYLLDCRRCSGEAFEPRTAVKASRIASGDQYSFHYEFAREYLGPSDSVLDIACGHGYGSALVAPRVARVTGADIDEDTVIENQKRYATIRNLEFTQQDATRLTFQDTSFDCVLSMETIEHVQDDVQYCREISRVLKPGGRLILSTPQSSCGRIPLNPAHIREYSLKDLRDLLGRHFSVEKVVGLKAGTVHFDGDPYGNNMLIVCRKS